MRDARGTERSIHRIVAKFRWVQDVFEPTESDDDIQPERGNTDSGKTMFDPKNTEMRQKDRQYRQPRCNERFRERRTMVVAEGGGFTLTMAAQDERRMG